MEVQKPTKDRQPQEHQQLLSTKTLESAASPAPNKPSPVTGSLHTPPPPAVPSHPQQTAPKEELEFAGELRKEGAVGGGEEQRKGAKPPAAEVAALGAHTAAAAAKAAAGGTATDLQKKLHRAERFGMPVQLSEEEKRNSRAERFGTTSTSHGKSEEQKRKARAERFGLAGHSTADQEAKKKARLARFGQDAKLDDLEEDKKKARAIRFSQTTSSALSQTSGKADSVLEAVTVENAKGGT